MKLIVVDFGLNYRVINVIRKKAGEFGWLEARDAGEFPFDQLPVLDITQEDGSVVRVAQSFAIERFLAKRFGLLGSCDIEALLIEQIQEACSDVVKAYMSAKEKGPESVEI